MNISPLIADHLYPSITFSCRTPDGILNAIFVEDGGKLVQVTISIGKAGASVGAWAQVTADMITLLLSSGMKPQTIMELLSSVTTGRTITDINGVPCRSGPEGLYICFSKYLKHKYQELADSLGIEDNSDWEDED